MVVKFGDWLLQEDVVSVLKFILILCVDLLIFNLFEVLVLLGDVIIVMFVVLQVSNLLLLGVKNVLIKGGYGIEDVCLDLLLL